MTARSTSCSSASRRGPHPSRTSPPRAGAARAGARARLQPVAPADVLPARRSTSTTAAPARRADDLLDAARRLDGLAAVRRDPRAARTRVFRQRLPPRLRRCRRCCSCRPGSSRASASRPTGGCGTSSPSCASDGPTEAEVERARAYAAGARAIAFENSGAVARYAAQQTIVFGEDVDPDMTIALLDDVTFDEVRERGRRGRRRALGRVRRSAHRGGAGDRLRRWLAVGLLSALGVAAITLAGCRWLQPHQQKRRAVRRGAAGSGSRSATERRRCPPEANPPLAPGPPRAAAGRRNSSSRRR